jgi:hypothetical protein
VSEAVDVFRRPHADGWLILAGEIPSLGGSTPELAEHLLRYVDLSWPPLFLTLDQEKRGQIAQFIEEMETLVGVAPRTIDLQSVPPTEYAQTSIAAGFLLLVGGDAAGWRAALDPNYPGLDGASLMSDGRVILAAASAAAALGSWMLNEQTLAVEPGLDWLPGAIILPGVMDPAEVTPVREQLQAARKAYAIGLPSSVLLALGPDNRIEVWSERSPVITLGAGWSQE